MAKIEKTDDGWYIHWCPGCEKYHGIPAEQGAKSLSGAQWTFNGDLEKPSFHPSVNYVGKCHYWVKDGMIDYCADSKHKYAGKKIPIPEDPE